MPASSRVSCAGLRWAAGCARNAGARRVGAAVLRRSWTGRGVNMAVSQKRARPLSASDLANRLGVDTVCHSYLLVRCVSRLSCSTDSSVQRIS